MSKLRRLTFVFMPHRQILRDIEAGSFKPLYLLHGEEPYFIDVLTKALEATVVEESMKDFNQTIFYGKDTEIDAILDAARRFPMMADRQLVLVREAQDLAAWRRSAEMERLEAYAKQPHDSTVLVFAFKGKKADGRLKAVKAIQQRGVVFLSERVRDYKLPAWIGEAVKESGLAISTPTATLLAEHLGTNLSKVMNELTKLAIVLPKGATITPEIIEEHIGISKDYNVFELQNALAAKDIMKANRIVNYFEANPKDHPVAMLMPVLGSFFSKLFAYQSLTDQSPAGAARALKCAPFAVKQYAEASKRYAPAKVGRIFGYLREADRKSKGQGNATVTDGMLLREAIFKILH